MTAERSWAVGALGYVGVDTADVDAWRSLTVEVLGLQEARTSTEDRMLLKTDTQRARLFVHRAHDDRLAYLGGDPGRLLELETAVAEHE